MNIIHLNDALQEMRKPEVFSLSFVTCDRGRNKGGEIISLEKALLSIHKKGASKFEFEDMEENLTGFKKAARHHEHATRNVILPNGHMKKFHIRLLLMFNGKKVYY